MKHECKNFEIKKHQSMNVLRCMDVGCDFYIELSYIPKLRTALAEREARIAELETAIVNFVKANTNTDDAVAFRKLELIRREVEKKAEQK